MLRTSRTFPAVVHFPGPTMKLTSCETVACMGGATATLTFVPIARLIEAAIAELSTAATAAMIALTDRVGVELASLAPEGLWDGAVRMVIESCSDPAAAESSMRPTGTP